MQSRLRFLSIEAVVAATKPAPRLAKEEVKQPLIIKINRIKKNFCLTDIPF
jgi:hypothetical protein